MSVSAAVHSQQQLSSAPVRSLAPPCTGLLPPSLSPSSPLSPLPPPFHVQPCFPGSMPCPQHIRGLAGTSVVVVWRAHGAVQRRPAPTGGRERAVTCCGCAEAVRGRCLRHAADEPRQKSQTPSLLRMYVRAVVAGRVCLFSSPPHYVSVAAVMTDARRCAHRGACSSSMGGFLDADGMPCISCERQTRAGVVLTCAGIRRCR